MTTYFETKEQFLTFRKAWSDAVNHENNKKHVVDGPYGRYKESAWLTGAHFMLYNILRGRSFDTGFTPITKRTKLENGAYLNHGLYNAAYHLGRVVNTAREQTNSGWFEKLKRVVKGDQELNWRERELRDFLEPLKDVVTVEMLASTGFTDISPIESNYGKGIKAKKAILAGANPKTFAELEELMENKEAA